MQPTSDRPSIWLTLSIVTGLPVVLWVYKCLMLVVFQRKFIYMGYAPLGSRQEEIKCDVPSMYLKGIRCEEIRITSEKKVFLSGIIIRRDEPQNEPPKIVIVYFQGNAGNPLHRIPVFRKLLRQTPLPPFSNVNVDMAIVAVAPRSFWKSSLRKPTERGILADYLHVLQYTLDRFPSSQIMIYGHSLGGAAATCLLSRLNDSDNQGSPNCKNMRYHDPRYKNIRGLVLENPFASIPHMVRALYPARWIPYRYLGPFAFDKWDAVAAMRGAASRGAGTEPGSVLGRLQGDMMVLLSEKDEVVPPEMGAELFEVSQGGAVGGGGMARKVVIKGALHDDAWEQGSWETQMRKYILEMDPK